MPQNKKKSGGGQSKGANQQVNQLLQALIKGMNQQKKNVKKKGNKKAQARPHFPLATPGDLRHLLTPYEDRLCEQNILNLFKQGAGHCTLVDSGGISFTVNFMLPTQHTVRLINANSATTS